MDHEIKEIQEGLDKAICDGNSALVWTRKYAVKLLQSVRKLKHENEDYRQQLLAERRRYQ